MILVSIQTLTFYLFGKESLKYQYFDKIENNNIYTGPIAILDNKYSILEKAEIEKRLLKRYKSVNIVSDSLLYFDKYRFSENFGGLSIDIKYYFPYMATVEEEHGGYQYGEFWETKFVWCFFTWIRYNHKCKGQS